jgi:hypothetical protein
MNDDYYEETRRMAIRAIVLGAVSVICSAIGLICYFLK